MGEGSKYDILVPGNSDKPVYLTLNSRTGDVMRIIEDLVGRGDKAIDYEVKGYATVPIKFFGVFQVFAVEVPFDERLSCSKMIKLLEDQEAHQSVRK